MNAGAQMCEAAGVLRRTWPQHTAKEAARAVNGSWRTAERWVRGICSPTLEQTLSMARECAALRAELRRTLDRMDHAENGLVAAGAVRAAAVEVVGGGRGTVAGAPPRPVKP